MIKDFYEMRFPEDIAFGASGGPEFNTNIISNHAGFEYRNINWPESRLRYNISSSIKNEDNLEELIAFFRIVRGRAIGFRFKDYTDYRAKNSLIAISDGNNLDFQLVKNYGNVSRIINKPVVNTVILYIDGRVVSQDLYKIDYTNGKIIFKEYPPKGVKISADFEFDVPVRFDTDSLSATNLGGEAYSFENISLIEVRI